MKHTLVVLAALTSLSTFASTEIKRLKVPGYVHDAVEENYEFGRNEADFGGISSVRYFKAIKGSQYRNLKGILSYLMKNEKGNITDVCADFSLSECVDRFRNGEHADSEYLDLYHDDDDHQEIIDFDEDIMTIHDFVQEKTPYGVKYTACENVWSVDACTTIIIDSKRGRAVTVDFDYGA